MQMKERPKKKTGVLNAENVHVLCTLEKKMGNFIIAAVMVVSLFRYPDCCFL